MSSDRMLKRWYDRYNREFFGGELPDDVAVFWEACAAHGETFEIESSVEGEPATIGIRINPACRTIWKGSRQGWAKLTLLHEMAHVKLWPVRGLQHHGQRFDQEIQRLCTFRSYRRLL